jgi:2-polyprenyl-3-methyl-5-hydroxy-6-metoxy-1,4-benzoquinol methylase
VRAYIYNEDFMQYAARSSAYSAAVMTSLIKERIPVGSVLDVGCALGTWLRAWAEAGVEDVYGLDGDYVDCNTLEIPKSSFRAVNLNGSFDLGRQFDLVQSLEVGEHIEESASEIFADNLARHARRYILFSAAPPGQGGQHHINERPYEFWRQLFEARGFRTLDAVRPAIIGDSRIAYWYRYNTLLFVRCELVPEIQKNLQDNILLSSDKVRDVSPLAFRLRKALVRRLSGSTQNKLAVLKARLIPTGRI